MQPFCTELHLLGFLESSLSQAYSFNSCNLLPLPNSFISVTAAVLCSPSNLATASWYEISPKWTSLASPGRGRSIPSQLCWVEDSFQLHRAPAEQRCWAVQGRGSWSTQWLFTPTVSSAAVSGSSWWWDIRGRLWHLTQMTQDWRCTEDLHPRTMSPGTTTPQTYYYTYSAPCFNCSFHQGCSCQAQHNHPKREQ